MAEGERRQVMLGWPWFVRWSVYSRALAQASDDLNKSRSAAGQERNQLQARLQDIHDRYDGMECSCRRALEGEFQKSKELSEASQLLLQMGKEIESLRKERDDLQADLNELRHVMNDAAMIANKYSDENQCGQFRFSGATGSAGSTGSCAACTIAHGTPGGKQ